MFMFNIPGTKRAVLEKGIRINKFSSYSDRELLAMLKQSDADAYAEIYDRYSNDLFAYAVTLVKLKQLAEDIVHDVFIKLWDIRGKINIEKDFRGYLFRSCHNRSCDVNKAVAKNRMLLDELIHYFQPAADPDQELSKAARDYVDLLKEALDTLTPQRRRIYEMCKFEKKNYVTVARELHISPNTVKNHMVQILAALRAYFRERHGTGLILFLILEKVF